MTILSFGISLYQWMSGSGVYISSGGTGALFFSYSFPLRSSQFGQPQQEIETGSGWRG